MRRGIDPNGTGTAGVGAATTFSASDYDGTVSYGSFSAPFVAGRGLSSSMLPTWSVPGAPGTLTNNGVAPIASGTDAGDLIFYNSGSYYGGHAWASVGRRLLQHGSGTFTWT